MKIVTKSGDIFTPEVVTNDVSVAVGYSDSGKALFVMKQHGDAVMFMTADDPSFNAVLSTLGLTCKLKQITTTP